MNLPLLMFWNKLTFPLWIFASFTFHTLPVPLALNCFLKYYSQIASVFFFLMALKQFLVAPFSPDYVFHQSCGTLFPRKETRYFFNFISLVRMCILLSVTFLISTHVVSLCFPKAKLRRYISCLSPLLSWCPLYWLSHFYCYIVTFHSYTVFISCETTPLIRHSL